MTTNILGVEHPDWEDRPEVPDRTASGGAGAGGRHYRNASQPAREPDEGEKLDYWSVPSPEPDDGTPEPDPTTDWPTRRERPRVAGAPVDDDWVSRPETPRAGGGPTPLPNTPAAAGSGQSPGGWPLRPESLRPSSSANHPISGPAAGGGSTPTPRGSVLPPGVVAGSEFWRTDISAGTGSIPSDSITTGGHTRPDFWRTDTPAGTGSIPSDSTTTGGHTRPEFWSYGAGQAPSSDRLSPDSWGGGDTSTGGHPAVDDHWTPPRAAVRSAPPAPPGSATAPPDPFTSTGEQRRVGGRHEAPQDDPPSLYGQPGHGQPAYGQPAPHTNDTSPYGHNASPPGHNPPPYSHGAAPFGTAPPYSTAPDPGSDAFWASRFAAGPWSEPEAPPRAEEHPAPGVPENWGRPDRPRPFSPADAPPDRQPAPAPPSERALALRRTAVQRVAVAETPADDLDDEDDERDYPAVLVATVLWYLLPALGYLVWAVSRSSSVPAGCTTLTGAACPSPRADAFGVLGDHWLVILATGVLSLVIAVMFRRFTPAWRALTVGFAAAVIGAGVTTLAHSLFG